MSEDVDFTLREAIKPARPPLRPKTTSETVHEMLVEDDFDNDESESDKVENIVVEKEDTRTRLTNQNEELRLEIKRLRIREKKWFMLAVALLSALVALSIYGAIISPDQIDRYVGILLGLASGAGFYMSNESSDQIKDHLEG